MHYQRGGDKPLIRRICGQICPMSRSICDLWLTRAVSDRYFLLSEQSLPAMLVISGQWRLVMPDMRVIHLKRYLSLPDMPLIFPVYAPYLAEDNPNDKSHIYSHIHHIVPARTEIRRISGNGYWNCPEWTQAYGVGIGWCVTQILYPAQRFCISG